MLYHERKPAELREFVEFWASRFFGYVTEKEEGLYVNNINTPVSSHTDETLRELFFWKVGNPYFGSQRDSIRANSVEQKDRVKGFPSDISAKTFLEKEFPKGGAVYRIFWLHCCYPDRFPIYDQHVHRAMTYIEWGKIQEIGSSDPRKVEDYLNEYLKFYGKFTTLNLPFDKERDGIQGRQADRALWTFGRCLLTSSLPKLRDEKGVDVNILGSQ